MPFPVCVLGSVDDDGEAIDGGTLPQLKIAGKEVAIVGSTLSGGDGADSIAAGSIRLTVGGLPVAFVGCPTADGTMATGEASLTVSG